MPDRAVQRGQLLAALLAAPLDRLSLMKTLFLFWYRTGKRADGAFQFSPYLYGPYSPELYSVLEEMQASGLVIQSAHAVERWGKYYLTEAGRKAAISDKSLSAPLKQAIGEIATWANGQTFYTLLQQVYREAPEFATQSIVQRARAVV